MRLVWKLRAGVYAYWQKRIGEHVPFGAAAAIYCVEHDDADNAFSKACALGIVFG